MSHIPQVLKALSRLLTYPDDQTVEAAELLYIILQGELPEAAAEASQFGAFLEQHETWETEESFTRTFDVNPACALEVGWHLFGEEYARGMFLVRMREELRKYGLPESIELPDHVSHVLSVVAAMPEDEAERFVRACVAPAVHKMRGAVDESESPYRHVMACLCDTLDHVWGAPAADNSLTRENDHSRTAPLESDPLRAFPVADVGYDCRSSCGAEPELVHIQTSLAPTEPVGDSQPVTPAKKP